MIHRRISDARLRRLEWRCSVTGFPDVELARARLADRLVDVRFKLEASEVLMVELGFRPEPARDDPAATA